MTETLQWSFVDCDSNELKLFKAYLDEEGDIDNLRGKLMFLLLV